MQLHELLQVLMRDQRHRAKFLPGDYIVIYNIFKRRLESASQMSLIIKDVQVETVQSTTEWTFVRVYAGKNYGTGEATAAPGLKASEPTLRKLLVGEDALKLNRIEEKLRHASLFAGSSFYPLISATNIALYDLIGKHVNLPVWRLLGGDRDEIRVYVDLHAGEEFGATNALLTPVKLDSTGKRALKGEAALSDHPVMGRLAREEFGELFTPEAYSASCQEGCRGGLPADQVRPRHPNPVHGRVQQAERPGDSEGGRLHGRDSRRGPDRRSATMSS